MELESGLDNRTKQAQSCDRDLRTPNFTNLLWLCQPSCQGFGLVAFISEGKLCLQVLCVCTPSAAGADAFGLLPQDNTLGRQIHSTDSEQTPEECCLILSYLNIYIFS